MKPERIVLESSSARTGLELPGHERLWSREMQRTNANSCLLAYGSSYLGRTIYFQAVVGIQPLNQTYHLPHLAKKKKTDELATRRDCETKRLTSQVVCSQRMMRIRTALAQVSVLLFLVGGSGLWMLVFFIVCCCRFLCLK